MTDRDHFDLMGALQNLRGMVALSGYQTDLYADALQGWDKRTTSARISGGTAGAVLRTECLWLNPACSRALRSMTA